MLNKAFLSHNSKDKKIVEKVAEGLSRANCIYDSYSFETGQEFSDAIEEGLNNSKIFVLFLGKETLFRPYVQEEISQAEKLYKKNQLHKCVTFIIDNDIDISLLPEWLKKIKYEKTSNPTHIVTIIKNMLDEINKVNRCFIGRDCDAEKFEEILIDNNKKRNIYFITGISGIGRKTFTKQMLKNKLSSYAYCVDVSPGDGALEMALGAMNALGESCNYSELYDKINAKPRKDRVEFLIKKLKEFLNQGKCIIFCDMGGIFHTDGSIDEEILEICHAISACQQLPVFFNTTMKPSSELKFKQQHLQPLSQKASKVLLRRLLHELPLDVNDEERIIARTAGYPPAIIYAAELALQYGVQADFLNKIKNSTHGMLSQYINLINIHNKDEIKLLALLCRYSPLTYFIIDNYLNKPKEDVFSIVEKLVNYSVIELVENRFYEISRPLEYTISTFLKEDILNINHLDVKNILNKQLEKEEKNIEGNLTIMRHLAKAKMFLKEKYNDVDMFSFISDVQKMADNAYHERNYNEAIEYAKIVINERKKLVEAHEILIKSLVREERFSEAQERIKEYKKFAQPKSIHFLIGFLKRYQDEFQDAIKAYDKAIENGYSGSSVLRELAQCYILLDDYNQALKYAELAYEKNDNIYIMDIYANALAHNKMLHKAKEIINKMLSTSKCDFVFQRAAVFELAHGDPHKAAELIANSIDVCKRITFDMLAQKILIACACDDAKTARDTYNEIIEKFSHKRTELQQALLMSIYFAEGDRESAILIYNKIKTLQKPFIRNIVKTVKTKFKL